MCCNSKSIVDLLSLIRIFKNFDTFFLCSSLLASSLFHYLGLKMYYYYYMLLVLYLRTFFLFLAKTEKMKYDMASAALVWPGKKHLLLLSHSLLISCYKFPPIETVVLLFIIW